MEDSQRNLLKAVQSQLISLRKKKGFDSALEFGNAASVNENKYETYLVNYQITTILKTVITLGVKINELITDEIIEKFRMDLEKEEEVKEKGE